MPRKARIDALILLAVVLFAVPVVGLKSDAPDPCSYEGG